MKRHALIVLLLTAMLTLGLTAGEKEFSKGSQYLTAQVGFNSYAMPFGANFEYALTENIGIGGTVMMQFWSEDWGFAGYNYGYSCTLITPSVEGAYHFVGLDADKLDVFAGAALGFSIYSVSWKDSWGGDSADTGSSSLYLSPFIGGRYYVSDKMAISAKLNFSAIGDFNGVGGTVGLTFRLK